MVGDVPRLWNSTIESHRLAVREAVLDAAAALVAEQGVTGLTMAQIAEGAGIGRATLYKYFPDVEAILVAWHQRHVRTHLSRLTALSDGEGDPWERLATVLTGYAQITYHRDRHGGDLGALVHRSPEVARAQEELTAVFTRLLVDAASTGELRGDVKPDELAQFCVHALGAAGSLGSQAAVRRLVAVTLSGMRAPS